MWTTILNSIKRNGGEIEINVGFNNGEDGFTKIFSFGGGTTRDQILLTIKRFVTSLNEQDVTKATLAPGSIDLSTVTEPTYTPTARELFSQKVSKLQSAKRAVDLGVIASNNTAYVNLLDSVKADMKAEYIDLF